MESLLQVVLYLSPLLVLVVMPGGLGDLGGGALEGLTGGGLGLPAPSNPTPSDPMSPVPFGF